MTFEEKTIKSNIVYKGAILNLRVDDVTVENGVSKREIVEHNGGAVIIGITRNKKIPMVRQYRKAANRDVFEVPAGKIDLGEEPKTAAIRELKEETGYSAENVRLLTKMYPSVGYSEEVLYIYIATNLSEGETNFDENEALEIEEWDLDDLFSLVMSGKIEDGKSQVAILMVKALQAEGKLPEYLK